MAPDFTTAIPQGDGTCRKCGQAVETIKFQGRKYTPTICTACLEEANREADEARTEVATEDQGIRPRFGACSFDTYHPNGNRRALDLCRVYADAFPPSDGSGLCLHGGWGTGKTHLAVSLARSVPGSYVMNAAELMANIRKGFDGVTDMTLERCLTAPLLVLDDLGQQKASEWVTEQLYILINRRYEYQLPTIVTTNIPPKDWPMRWGGAIASRVTGMSTIIELKGVDYRSVKQ